MNDIKPPLSKETPVTIGLVLALLGAAGWTASGAKQTEMQTQTNARDIADLQQREAAHQRSNKKLEKWLAAIGQKLGVREPQE